jgi:hypothetical protein
LESVLALELASVWVSGLVLEWESVLAWGLDLLPRFHLP